MKKYYELIMSVLVMLLVIMLDVYLYYELPSSVGKTSVLSMVFTAGLGISYIYYITYKMNDK